MKRGTTVFLLVFATLVAVPLAVGQKTTSVKVTTIIYDNDAAGAQLHTRSDDYDATGQATYTSSSLKNSTLNSTLSNGEWKLTLSNQSVRTLWITPNDAVDTTQPAGPPAGYYWDGTTIASSCFDQNGNSVPLQNVVTSSGMCKLGINFTSAGTKYKLLMSPFPLSGPTDPPATCPSAGCPATGWVTVTCNTVSNNQCVNWTITPNTTAANANIANLYRYSSVNRTATWVYMGQYHQSFRVDVTNP